MPPKRGQRSTQHKRAAGKRAANPRRRAKPATPAPRRKEVRRRAVPAARPAAAAPVAAPATPPTFLEVTPSLAVRDVNRSLNFYRRLGFRAAAQLPPSGSPEWVRLERDKVALLIWNEVIASPEVLAAIGSGRGAGNAVRITVADADSLARELEDNGVALRRPPETMPEGVRELCVLDPDGYLIEFASRLPARGDSAQTAP